MPNNYHIAAVKNSLPDIQKNNLWLVEIQVPNLLPVHGLVPPTSKSLQIRAKEATIPGRTINSIETNFLGMKSTYAGSEDMSGKELSIGFYEYEDQHITETINCWLNNIFDSMDSKTSEGGHGLVGQKYKNGTRGIEYGTDIRLVLLGMNGEPLDKKVLFHTAWPKSIEQISLSYDGSAGVETSVTFQFDWWELI